MRPAPMPGIAAAAPTASSVDEQVAEGLRAAAQALRGLGVAVPEPGGKLLRPAVALALVPRGRLGEIGDRFWSGALAVQMVHEASLLHDDILDGAGQRRAEATVVASRGIGTALVVGDHYLTGAYRAAVATGSQAFSEIFVRAVERTVAGEIRQGHARGRRVHPDEYQAIVVGKSGELFGAAAALGGAILGLDDLEERVGLGCALGALYQRVDDLLDLCPAAGTGKPPLQDYRQRKWTWVLDLAGLADFTLSDEEVLERLFAGLDGGPSAARRAVDLLRYERDALKVRLASLSADESVVGDVVDGWVRAAERGVVAQERASLARPAAFGGVRGHGSPAAAEAEVAELARRLGGPEEWEGVFRRNARTFRFAARLFPGEAARRVRDLYVYCRFTDDLVDEFPVEGRAHAEARLGAWRALTRAAFEGVRTGVPLLDQALGEAARTGVSWRYPDALLDGVGRDLAPADFRNWEELEGYTFGVAGAVGGWMSQLLGFREPRLLESAHALGHAMQLTNILRDVGEDLERGRLYLPSELLEEHGLSRTSLESLKALESPLPPSYRDAMDGLMAHADAWYARAWPGIRRLPPWFRRPVAVAAAAYRGIHREVRRNGYDNLRHRARTSLPTKLVLAAGALGRARS